MGKAKITVSKKYFGPKGESLKKIWSLMRLLQLIKMKGVKHVSTV